MGCSPTQWSGGRLCTRILGSQVHADGSGPESQVQAEVWRPGSQVHAGSCWRACFLAFVKAICFTVLGSWRGTTLFCPWVLPLSLLSLGPATLFCPWTLPYSVLGNDFAISASRHHSQTKLFRVLTSFFWNQDPAVESLVASTAVAETAPTESVRNREHQQQEDIFGQYVGRMCVFIITSTQMSKVSTKG